MDTYNVNLLCGTIGSTCTKIKPLHVSINRPAHVKAESGSLNRLWNQGDSDCKASQFNLH